MKKIFKCFAVALVLSLSFALLVFGVNLSYNGVVSRAVNAEGISSLGASSPYLNASYLEIYSIPTEKFSYSTDGGMDANLQRAFDRNMNTFWESDWEGNKHIVDPPNGVTISIELDFDAAYAVDRVLFGNEPGTERGFPLEFKIYGKVGSAWQELRAYTAEYSRDIIMASFEPITLNGLRFEYIRVHNSHRWSATCRELIVLQPESQEMEQVRNLFSDTYELTLNENIKTNADINNIRAAIKGYASEAGLLERLRRAEQVLAGTLKFDPLREMSTNSEAANVITQRGDIAGYARNTLKMAWFGTNRQSTGIYVKPNEVLTVYVDTDQTENLPTITYSQFWGHWKSWLSSSFQLRPGKNVIEIKSLIHDISEYTHYDEAAGGTILGGPVYISNPYEPSQQPSEIKVYFEGGTPFPVFRLGDDETRYKYELRDYAEYVNANPTTAINVTELVSENFIMTVRATVANETYKSHSPEQNLRTWDAYIKEVLAYDGVVFEAGKQYYDPRSQYLNCNVRMAQPTGEAYAHVEHVGIQAWWEQAVLYSENFGWGYTHEFGHMMDNPERTISECSNNMMSKYNETAMEKDASRGEFESTLNSLSPDDYVSNFFDQHDRLNYLIWWLIESYDIGFWGRLENFYRYEPVSGLAKTEKQVYLASLAAGFDLAYYFERWGYSMTDPKNRANDPVFKISTATQTFNDYMNAAKAQGRINDDKAPKIWYLDSKQYLKKLDGNTSCYSSLDFPSILSVTKSGNGYNIVMSSDKSGLDAHLGYEIWEGSNGNFKVVGFSHSDAWTDTRSLPSSYVPTYKIVAYDRELNPSGESAAMMPSEEEYVCQIGDDHFSSLSAAVKAASGGATIYLYKDCADSDIVINKNITIRLDESVSSDTTISLVGKNNLFYVLFEQSLKILGNSSHRIILDGGNYTHEGSLVRLAGYMDLEYVTLQNSKSKTDGGAIRIVYEGSYQALNAKWVEIRNCSGLRGGAIYDGSRYMAVTIDNSIIEHNVADRGGAIFMENGTTVSIKNSEICNNSATYGGAIAGDSYIEIIASNIHDNTATKYGGAICFSTTVAARQVYLKGNSTFSNNSAELGSTAYIIDGVLNIISARVVDADLTDEKYTIYLKNSTLSIHAGQNAGYNAENLATLSGRIFVDNDSQILVYNKMFETETPKLRIVLEELSTGAVYCEARNYQFSEEDKTKLAVEGNITIGESNQNSALIAALAQVEFTFIVNGVQTKIMVDVNSTFILPFECGLEDKFAARWTNSSGSFLSGSPINVTTAQTFTAELEDKVRLSLDSGLESENHYFVPGTRYVLPRPTYEHGQFVCWFDDDQNQYFAYSELTISDNLTLHASIAGKLKVTFKLNGEELFSQYVVYDEYLEFPSVNIPEGKRIAYYLVNGEKTPGGFVNAVSNTVIDAILEDIPAASGPSAPEQSGSEGNKISPILIGTIVGGALLVIAAVVIVVVIKKRKANKN